MRTAAELVQPTHETYSETQEKLRQFLSPKCKQRNVFSIVIVFVAILPLWNRPVNARKCASSNHAPVWFISAKDKLDDFSKKKTITS